MLGALPVRAPSLLPAQEGWRTGRPEGRPVRAGLREHAPLPPPRPTRTALVSLLFSLRLRELREALGAARL